MNALLEKSIAFPGFVKVPVVGILYFRPAIGSPFVDAQHKDSLFGFRVLCQELHLIPVVHSENRVGLIDHLRSQLLRAMIVQRNTEFTCSSKRPRVSGGARRGMQSCRDNRDLTLLARQFLFHESFAHGAPHEVPKTHENETAGGCRKLYFLSVTQANTMASSEFKIDGTLGKVVTSIGPKLLQQKPGQPLLGCLFSKSFGSFPGPRAE
jgi:hypothetical protein